MSFCDHYSQSTVEKSSSVLGIILYLLLNVCYTTAVFTNPGTPLVSQPAKQAGYTSLPTVEPDSQPQAHGITYASLTSKSSGQPRFCKKCQCAKPDRAHHCSACGRCVLKMDHHCPWLATCVGLHNYKAFILFITYTALFCWLCCIKSTVWVWNAIADEDMSHIPDATTVINSIILCVLAGVIGLTLTFFSGFHWHLVASGQTTIESLEKTHYLGPVKRNMESQFRREKQQALSGAPRSGVEQIMSPIEHFKTFHANALPGVTRPEEGIEDDDQDSSGSRDSESSFVPTRSPAQDSLRRSYAEREMKRETDRYANYLDERDSERLPHAFDLGISRNFIHVMGAAPLLWFVPVMNSLGDGWKWDVSQDWLSECDALLSEREKSSHPTTQNPRNGNLSPYTTHGNNLPSPVPVPRGPQGPASQDRSWSRGRDGYESTVTMQSLGRRARPSTGAGPEMSQVQAQGFTNLGHAANLAIDAAYEKEMEIEERVATLSVPRPRSTSGEKGKGD